MSRFAFFKRCLLASAVALIGLDAGAATIGYWRMEVDLDPSAEGLEVANEVAGGSSLLSSEAFVDTLANPNGTVPSTGSPNLGSVGATRQGGSNGINGTVAWYAALDTSSITLEFWARTNENQATLFSRTSGGADGIEIHSPSSLTVEYYVEDGIGGSTLVTLSNLTDMDTNWHHYAFTYDEASGVGSFFVDEVLVGSNDGADGRALVWGSNVDLQLGYIMDYSAAFNGTLDEVRIDDNAVAPSEFLSVAAPGPLALGLATVALLSAPPLRRRWLER